MLGFLGDSDEILNLMQRLSHSTRAYLVNAKGLKGFLVLGITAIFKEAE